MTEDRLRAAARSDTTGGADITTGAGQSLNCPQFVAWPRDRVVTVYEGGRSGDALAVIHRGEITKTARDCQLYSDRVVVKYGFAGRVLLGPKGRAGSVTLPIKVHVSDREHRVLNRENMRVTANVDGSVGYFSMVKEVSFPITPGTRAEDYKLFIAFDQVPGAG
jgi:hypothetical protein